MGLLALGSRSWCSQNGLLFKFYLPPTKRVVDGQKQEDGDNYDAGVDYEIILVHCYY